MEFGRRPTARSFRLSERLRAMPERSLLSALFDTRNSSFMEREGGRHRSVERVDPTTGGEPADRAAGAAYGAAHAFVLVAHDQDRRAGEIELADPLRSVRVEPDDRDTALTSCGERTDQGRHSAQPRVLYRAGRRATGCRTERRRRVFTPDHCRVRDPDRGANHRAEVLGVLDAVERQSEQLWIRQ